jgi:hypothetical protein
MECGMRKNRLSNLVIALGLAAASSCAVALGFGDFRASALLGQPLNVALPVTLAEGETLTSDCVSAEVQAGDSRLPPGSVRARVTQGRDASEAVVRITSSVPIDEPIVNLTVSAGCPTRITRSVVLLADPPLVTVQQPAAAAAAPVPGQNLPQTSPVAAGTAEGSPGAGTGAPSAATPRATRPAAPTRAERAAAPRPSVRADRAETPAAQSAPAARPRSSAAARPAPAPRAASEGRPRLQLDGGQVAAPAPSPAPAQPASPSPAQVAAEQQAAAAQEAVKAAEAAASAAQQRMKDMEAEVGRLRAEAKAQTEALVELRKQIAQDRNRGSEPGWFLPALLALAALLGGTALWLWWKLKQQQQVRVMQRDAWFERAAPGSSVAPSVQSRQDDEDEDEDSRGGATVSRIPSTLPPPSPAPAPAPRLPQATPSMFDTRAGGLDSMISPPTMPAHTAVTLPIGAAVRAEEDESLRAVSVDEQIDLEQQADFFVALGHDESAIDLLMAHLRSTGGGTPLPFLKLLEIHRRRGDRDAYERTRVRFNQRFNSVAPDWQADPKEGRSLEDYPLVVGRVQTAWPKPLDAMAELEALLFRRGAGSELFELPAYQELLFLYQLARDLHQLSQPDASSDVDVLLPISTDMAPLVDGGGISLDLELGGSRVPQGDKPMLELDLGDLGDTPPGGKPPG